MYIYIHTHTHTHTIYIYIHTHTHTHTHIYIHRLTIKEIDTFNVVLKLNYSDTSANEDNSFRDHIR